MRALTPLLIACAMVASLLRPAASSAQAPERGWPAPQIGVRIGYDSNASATVVGGQLRVPVLPQGWLELMPSGDVTFLTGLRQYQFNADAVAILGSRGSGVYAGGGIGWVNTIFAGPDRETRTGANLVVGLTSRGFGSVPFGTQLEIRYTFLEDVAFKPRILTLGVNFPFWGWGGSRGRP